MIKPSKLKKGDAIAIVSLSRGLLGEPFIKHELDLGLKRIREMGMEPVIMPNALKGMEFLKAHPDARAEDLKAAFMDPNIKAILCAIGGNDTYEIFPYLMEDEEFREAVGQNPKIFCGFSDSTMDHLLLHRLGLVTFYGPSFLVDFAELDSQMIPYTKTYFEKFLKPEVNLEITSSPKWYEERESYGVEELGKPRICHEELHGYEVLNGSGIHQGFLYGGCIESIYEAMTGREFPEEKEICQKYQILLKLEEWKDKILFLETSDEKITPEVLKTMLEEFKKRGILENIEGVLVEKPVDETYYEEYKEVYREVFQDLKTPVLYNLNFGHSTPRCILPYGVEVIVDYDHLKVQMNESYLQE